MASYAACCPSLSLLVAMAAPVPAPAQTEVRTQLGWLRNGEFAPVMVAEAKGFFTEEGIRHRIMDGGPGKNPVPIVGAGQATFGITAGGNNVFQARLAKDPGRRRRGRARCSSGVPTATSPSRPPAIPTPSRRTSRARPSGCSPTARSS